MKKIWVLAACHQCEREFIFNATEDAPKNADNEHGLNPDPDFLTCPYCRNVGVTVTHFPEVKL